MMWAVSTVSAQDAVYEPGDAVASGVSGDAEHAEAAADADEESQVKTVSVSFRNTELSQIAAFYGRELDKPVIVDQGISNTRLTIMSNKELPLPEAFELIGNALRQKGVIVVEGPRQVELLPIAQIRRINRRVVPAERSVTELVDHSTIVDKIFRVEHYDVTRLKDLIVPVLPEYAFLVADPNLDRIVVTAAAGDLVHIEQLVQSLDVPRADDTVERIFTIENGDASEIATLVRTILAGTLGQEGVAAFTSPVRSGGNRRGNNNNNNNSGGGGGGGGRGGGNTVFVERSEAPIMLQADLSRNWIIAAAPPAVMDEIARWITEFDQPKERNEPYVLFDITHADVDELASQINEAISEMPDADIRSNLRVIPFVKSRQILVYGSQRGRSLVRSLLNQLDIESSQFQVIKEIALKHDSAENVKAKVEELFNPQQDSGRRVYYFGRSRPTKQELTVTADTQRNTVTIKTDAPRMRRIEKIIREQWDLPIDLDEVKPKIYRLQYTDPVLVQELLDEMFTTSSSTTSFGFFFDDRTTETSTPVGRLFGEFSFNAMQDSDKLIVSTKNPANYVVIDELLAEIDQPQTAGVPVVVELKHANAEDVAEQLNAMFSEPGTPAAITRTERGLSNTLRAVSSVGDGSGGQGQNNNPNNNQNRNNNGGDNDPTQMNFWWSQSRPNVNEQPVSNLIGKPRVVPVNRRNAVMIISPRAHVEPMRNLIYELDRPGAQVAIHAVIAEVQHDDESTLGVRVASDPSIFSESRLADQSISGGIDGNVAEAIFRGDGVINADFDLNFLIQFLVSNLELKILNEPRVYTADNQEAHFFDGQDIPVITDSLAQAASDSGNVTQTFDYESVGTRLHVRPHITQDGEIDLRINLELSRVVSGASVFGNPIFDRQTTTTHVTLKDGQTIVISGMIEREDFTEVRKLPLFGDLPLVGGLFRNTDEVTRNREVIAFVTPHILRNGTAEVEEDSDRNQKWLERLRGAGVDEPYPPLPEETQADEAGE